MIAEPQQSHESVKFVSHLAPHAAHFRPCSVSLGDFVYMGNLVRAAALEVTVVVVIFMDLTQFCFVVIKMASCSDGVKSRVIIVDDQKSGVGQRMPLGEARQTTHERGLDVSNPTALPN